jgi:hypothetical protein
VWCAKDTTAHRWEDSFLLDELGGGQGDAGMALLASDLHSTLSQTPRSYPQSSAQVVQPHDKNCNYTLEIF